MAIFAETRRAIRLVKPRKVSRRAITRLLSLIIFMAQFLVRLVETRKRFSPDEVKSNLIMICLENASVRAHS